MKCPDCGLINPPEAQTCDCGYDFAFRRSSPRWAEKQSEGRRGLLLAAFLCLTAFIFVVFSVTVLPSTEFKELAALLRWLALLLWLSGTIIWAQAKGWSWTWGLLGLSILGALIIAFLPNRNQPGQRGGSATAVKGRSGNA